MIPDIFPYKSSITCYEVVGLGLPDVLALGAARGNSSLSRTYKAILWSGILNTTEGRPPVTESGTILDFGNRSEIGPGQNRFPMISAS